MPTILLVEPDTRLAHTYASMLRGHGYRVEAAATAQSAVEAADAATPDIVLLELQLTAHSGIEFLYEFRSYREWQAIPVIVLSHVPPAEFAASQTMLRQRLGVVTYRYKPRTSLPDLLHSVTDTIAKAAA